MSSQQFEQELASKLNRLPKQMQPEKDLWQGIDIALTRQQQSGPAANDKVQDSPTQVKQNNVVSLDSRFLAMAASILAVAALSWNFMKPEVVIGQPVKLVNALTEQHQLQKNALLASYSETQAVSTTWQQQLAELERAADAIKEALKAEPENVALLKMLQHVYQQQIELIEKVHAPSWNQI